jgi:hypothetical protein
VSLKWPAKEAISAIRRYPMWRAEILRSRDNFVYLRARDIANIAHCSSINNVRAETFYSRCVVFIFRWRALPPKKSISGISMCLCYNLIILTADKQLYSTSSFLVNRIRISDSTSVAVNLLANGYLFIIKIILKIMHVFAQYSNFNIILCGNISDINVI